MRTEALLVRNTLLNVFAQGAPILVAIYAIPLVLHSLGLERFAILSFAWLILGFAGLFDLGVARATAKIAAESLAANDCLLISRLGSTAVFLNAALGMAGAVLLAVASPFLVKLLHVQPDLESEAIAAFGVVAAALPVSVVLTAARSLLEARQRFGLINSVQAPANVLLYAVPAVGALSGASLPLILMMMVGTRVAGAVAYVALWRVAYPRAVFRAVFDRLLAKRLLRYGGWLTVSSVVAPLIVYGERAIVAASLALGSLSLYVLPYELVARLWIVPAALMSTLYPTFSFLRSTSSELRSAYNLGVKLLIISVGPAAMIIFLLSGELLVRWLGAEAAPALTVPLQIFVIGALVNSLAYVPLALLQGVGRPDLPAKIHASEILPALFLTWFLSSQFGLVGAVFAWLARVVVDAGALFVATAVVEPQTTRPVGRALIRAVAALSAGTIVVALLLGDAHGAPRVAAGFASAAAYAAWAWRYYLDREDRRMFFTLIQRRSRDRAAVGT
jgi:O-antigen/teichoic acid export membrane protein